MIWDPEANKTFTHGYSLVVAHVRAIGEVYDYDYYENMELVPTHSFLVQYGEAQPVMIYETRERAEEKRQELIDMINTLYKK